MTDPISDMLTRIRNALLVRKAEVVVPHSKLKASLAALIAREGYLEAVEEVQSPSRALKITLRYRHGAPAIRVLHRASRPGRRYYVSHTELPYVRSGTGIAIISTSSGLMTNREARKQGLGGEVLCEIA